jgi:hypothetical protein
MGTINNSRLTRLIYQIGASAIGNLTYNYGISPHGVGIHHGLAAGQQLGNGAAVGVLGE